MLLLINPTWHQVGLKVDFVTFIYQKIKCEIMKNPFLLILVFGVVPFAMFVMPVMIV